MAATAIEIAELLQDCTVRLISSVQGTRKSGTGFFVAPGLLLTCLHVVEGSSLEAEWKDRKPGVRIESIDPGGRDLALVAIDDSPDYPTTVLGEGYPAIGERLVTFGYTEAYPQGDSGSYECEGASKHATDGWLIKVKAGQAFPGMSGGPLVSLTSGRVCAVMATERLNAAMGGARAVPVETACRIWPHLKRRPAGEENRRQRWMEVFSHASEDDRTLPLRLANALQFSIPKDWTFQDVIDTMVSIKAALCDYQGFTPDELNAKIQARQIAAESLTEAILQLRLMTVTPGAVRRYEVVRKGSMFLLQISGEFSTPPQGEPHE